MPGHEPKRVGHEPKRTGQFFIGPLPQRLSFGAIRKKYDVSAEDAAGVRAAVIDHILPKAFLIGSKAATVPVLATHSLPRRKKKSSSKKRRKSGSAKSSGKGVKLAKKKARPGRTRTRRRKTSRGK